jgi:hypothetical protein
VPVLPRQASGSIAPGGNIEGVPPSPLALAATVSSGQNFNPGALPLSGGKKGLRSIPKVEHNCPSCRQPTERHPVKHDRPHREPAFASPAKGVVPTAELGTDDPDPSPRGHPRHDPKMVTPHPIGVWTAHPCAGKMLRSLRISRGAWKSPVRRHYRAYPSGLIDFMRF